MSDTSQTCDSTDESLRAGSGTSFFENRIAAAVDATNAAANVASLAAEAATEATRRHTVAIKEGEYVVIARRYRPQAFDELLGQEHVARALQKAITSERVGHAYLFTGARGVGKTSAARILAKALNCERGPTPTPCNECDVCRCVTSGHDVDVIEIDGASNRGIDEIRQLRQNAAVRPSRARFKIYIIDEVHMLTKEAFNALLKTLEEPPEHVKFIFATTEPHKIPITILSRCQRFDFAGIRSGQIQARLMQIAATEGVEIEPEATQILASRAAGSMRDSQSLLEQLLAVGGGKITASDVTQLLGIAPAERLTGLVRHLVERNAVSALAELEAAIDGGVDVGQLLDQLIGFFRDVMTAAVGCPPEQMLYALPSQSAEVVEIGRRLGVETILAIVQVLDQTSSRMRITMHGRTLVEMAVVRICNLENLEELATLAAELRGETPATPPADARSTASAGPRIPIQPVAPAASKKNDEVTPAAASLGSVPALPELENHVANAPSADESVESSNGTDGVAHESVLKRFQDVISAAPTVATAPAAPRVSRREQLLEQSREVSTRPFVQKAIELFDVGAGQFRYTPPEGDSTS